MYQIGIFFLSSQFYRIFRLTAVSRIYYNGRTMGQLISLLKFKRTKQAHNESKRVTNNNQVDSYSLDVLSMVYTYMQESCHRAEFFVKCKNKDCDGVIMLSLDAQEFSSVETCICGKRYLLGAIVKEADDGMA
jgi:hypothetical protein